MQGVSITLIGLTITFSALGLFILVIYLLKRIFPSEKKDQQMNEASEGIPAEASLPVDRPEEAASPVSTDEAISVAIAVALRVVQARRQSQLGKLLLEPRRQLSNPGFQVQPVVRRSEMK